MKEYGFIEIQVTRNIDGLLESRTYRWKGPPTAIIDVRHLDDSRFPFPVDGDVVNIGPYRMKVVDTEYSHSSVVVIRMDYPLWWILYFAHKATRTLRIIYARTIITLAVWRLAQFHPAAEPSWRDIYAFQWIKKIFS